MRKPLSRASRLSVGVAIIGITVATGTTPALAVVDSAPTTQASRSADPQSVPEEDSEDYSGLAKPGASTAPADDDAGDPKPARLRGSSGTAEADPDNTDVPGAVVVEPPAEDATLEPPSAASGDSAQQLRRAVAKADTIRVVVSLRQQIELEADLTRAEVREQRSAIESRVDTLQKTLSGTDSRVVTEFEVVPSAVAEVDSDGLESLLADPQVTAVNLDREAPLALDVSTGVIDSDLLNAAGVLGNNFEGGAGGAYEVAILDSGVDSQHNAVGSSVVAQACFSATSWCPNGLTSQVGGAAGDNCTYSTECDHGTHVGGIAGGNSFTGGHEGVAAGAGIVAIQIGHRSLTCQPGEPNPCWRYFFSDLDLALQHTLNLRNGGRNIAAINLSLGGPLHGTEAACGAAFPNTQNLAANLTAAGVAVVAAAGNDASSSSVSYPGCLPSTYTVAASDDNDNPAGFSNNNAITDWWAPGVNIDAPVTTGVDAHGNKSGTSMATPHVVGSMALLRECIDPATEQPQTVDQAAGDLYATGTTITHDGISRQRINVLDAATRNVNNNDFVNAETLPGNVGAGFNDKDWNVCADSEPGEPGPFSLDNSIWWNWTPSATGTATISTDPAGGNVTTFDTTLAVYTGNSIGSLGLYASDDDGGAGLNSQVVVPVNGGTTYRIKVDGFAASNGLLNLHVENGPPPTCFGDAATLVGTPGDNVLNGTGGADVIVAGAGNDVVSSGAGDDRVCGDEGADNIATGPGDDFVLGGAEADTIRGEDGDDILVGNPGGGSNDDSGDAISGGPGSDFIDGWFGDDVLFGGPGDDQLRGEAGIDTVNYAGVGGAVEASLTTGVGTGEGNDSYVLVENLVGTAFNDQLVGSADANVLVGASGNDRLNGMAGDDTVDAGTGNDRLLGRDGNDTFAGGPGVDLAVFEHSPASVNVNLVTNVATGEGNDSLSSIQNVIGSNFADTIRGNVEENELYGGSASDVLRAKGANDRLFGERGGDSLFGEAGADHLSGGSQVDTCNGGPGNDSQNTCENKVSIP